MCGAGGTDGYDDGIHTLLLAADNARLLSANLAETSVAQAFLSGAIDRIAVMRPMAAASGIATVPDVIGTSFLGSDHRPVLAAARVIDGRSGLA